MHLIEMLEGRYWNDFAKLSRRSRPMTSMTTKPPYFFALYRKDHHDDRNREGLVALLRGLAYSETLELPNDPEVYVIEEDAEC